jgi:hypothetical protein
VARSQPGPASGTAAGLVTRAVGLSGLDADLPAWDAAGGFQATVPACVRRAEREVASAAGALTCPDSLRNLAPTPSGGGLRRARVVPAHEDPIPPWPIPPWRSGFVDS